MIFDLINIAQINDVHGHWSVAIIIAALLIGLIYSGAKKGFGRGPYRQLAGPLAFFVAVAVSYFFGLNFGYAVLGNFGVPWILRGLLGFVILFVIVWTPVFVYCWHKGKGQVSEQTGDPDQPILGILVGIVTGLFWCSIVIFILTIQGAFAKLVLEKKVGTVDGVPGKCLYGMMVVKKSISYIPGLGWTDKLILTPPISIQILHKSLLVWRDPRAQQKMKAIPAVQAIFTMPTVYPVLTDKEISDMFSRGDINGLLGNKKIKALLEDDELQKHLIELEFEKLLDYALGVGEMPKISEELMTGKRLDKKNIQTTENVDSKN